MDKKMAMIFRQFFLRILFMYGAFLRAEEYSLTIITSVFNGDRYIQHFLEQIAKQTIYDKCQHIIINANSPGHEEEVILHFAKEHPNVEYTRLEQDPGLYAVWNMAIKNSRADYLVNANLDDRLAPFAYELLLRELEEHPEVALVYSDAYITDIPNQTFGSHSYLSFYSASDFSYAALQKACFIGSHPLWRKSMHKKHGLFNEQFLCAGDWEMWLRAASQGAIFLHVNTLTGLNYLGPEELTNRRDLIEERQKERNFLKRVYHIS
jgi:glycosyltransferase involved in cell wall biosynthesis